MAQHASAFSQAVEEFATRPTKKKRSFVQRMWEEKLIVSPEEVQASLFDFQKDHSQRASRKVLKPVFDALRDYDKIMDVLSKPHTTFYSRDCIDSQNHKSLGRSHAFSVHLGRTKSRYNREFDIMLCLILNTLLVADCIFSVFNGIMNYLNDSKIRWESLPLR